MYIDTHTHLFSEKFEGEYEAVIQRALDAGVDKLLLPNIDLDTVNAMNALEEKYPNNCFSMMGLHPSNVTEDVDHQLDLVKKELYSRPYIAVGEIGIDLYWDKTLLAQQQKAFEQQLLWAKELNLPIVIHARESFDEIFEIVDKHNDENLTGVFHCFTGTVEQAQKIIAYGGFKMGIGGVVTFKKAGLDKVVKEIPLEHLVLETDAPYLAPSPNRGKRNESAYIPFIADKLSDIFEMPVEEIAAITTKNAEQVFPKIIKA
ncbi:TatD family hydrolase [Lishizhenia sp.]|uniref:TatD family hydrolase n=1 Tax=Lishizhenia sp. TaxID=2497594 RepID=UPI00299D1183|nr:TatD family hydrolase [Lishizhenia sp.]MDX1445949.1 TatD family hydrolase [Lishizhenia sp.]